MVNNNKWSKKKTDRAKPSLTKPYYGQHFITVVSLACGGVLLGFNYFDFSASHNVSLFSSLKCLSLVVDR